MVEHFEMFYRRADPSEILISATVEQGRGGMSGIKYKWTSETLIPDIPGLRGIKSIKCINIEKVEKECTNIETRIN